MIRVQGNLHLFSGGGWHSVPQKSSDYFTEPRNFASGFILNSGCLHQTFKAL
jgi:hypothetical protein